jgi:eukaryotic-like serine/threonine-protein kinase
LLEFGQFRVDPEQRLLLRDQRPIPLSPKAFDLLLVLVERSGQVVLKDDLMKLLWPDTFVEESNLGQHVFQLRKALGERAQDSSYIVTVPGRGYRFAEKVRTLPVGEEMVVESTRSRLTIEHTSRLDVAKRFSKPRNWMLGATLLMVLAAVFIRYTRNSPVLKEADLVLVSDFVNMTGEPIFDDTLKQALTVKLAESPYFNVALDAQTRQTMGLMKRSADERVVAPIAREVCQREGAKALIGGSIVRLGNKYVLDLDAMDCLTGASLAHQKIETANREQVLHQLGEAIIPVRRKLGESLSPSRSLIHRLNRRRPNRCLH